MARNMIEAVNVVDVESTCWDGDQPVDQDQEIIQVGLTVVALHFPQIIRTQQWMVQPLNSTVSPFCTQLTGITQEQVDAEGVPFRDVCDCIRKEFDTRERIWVSWGDYDRGMFEKQCNRNGVQYPFGRRHLNLKSLCALLYGLRYEQGMDGMLDYLNMPLEGTHHQAGDDSKNIARIFLRVLETFQFGHKITLDARALEREGR